MTSRARQEVGGPRGPYVLAVVHPLIHVLNSASGGQADKLIGLAANVEFWESEVRHAMVLLEGYSARSEAYAAARIAYAKEHFPARPPPDVEPSIAPETVKKVRGDLARAAQHFADRLHDEKFIDERTRRDFLKAIRQHGGR